MSLDFVFVSQCDLPLTMGRQAHRWYEPIVAALREGGFTCEIIAETPAGHRAFTHTEPMMRWLHRMKPRLTVFWTSKSHDKYLAESVRHWGLEACHAELGWFPDQETSIYFDPQGCGPDSSLCKWEPKYVVPAENPMVVMEGPVGIVGQVDGDDNFAKSGISCNEETLVKVTGSWPDEKFLFRPHPNSGPVALPPGVEIDESETLDDFFDKVKCVVGANSGSLLHSLEYGHITYQMGRGIGAESGAFMKSLRHPSKIPVPRLLELGVRAGLLLDYLRSKVQVRLDSPTLFDDLVANRCLGPAMMELAGI